MLEKVPVTELRPDMYIHAFCARWIDHPLFRSGFVLQRQDELKKILASGMAELGVDTAKGAGPGTGVERPAVPVLPDLRPTVPSRPRHRRRAGQRHCMTRQGCAAVRFRRWRRCLARPAWARPSTPRWCRWRS